MQARVGERDGPLPARDRVGGSGAHAAQTGRRTGGSARVRRVPRRVRRSSGVVYVLTVWVLVMGTLVTAAGPHGGDAEAKRLSSPIPDLARVHAISVDVLVGLVLVSWWCSYDERAPRRVLTIGVGRARGDGRAGHPRLRAVRAGHPGTARRVPRRGRGTRVRLGALAAARAVRARSATQFPTRPLRPRTTRRARTMPPSACTR